MNKLLIILVALLWCFNANAELNIIYADENQIWVKLPKGTSKSIRYSSKRLDYVKDHCTKLKKNTYTFSYKGFSDVDPGGFGRDQFRFICARSKFEAVQNIKLPIPKYGKYARTFTSKYQKKIEEDNVSPVVAHIEYSHEEFQYTEEEIKQIKIAEKKKKDEEEKKKIIAENPEKKEPTEPILDDKKLIIIGSGSGFFVSDQGHIVSNEHVVGVCKKVSAFEEGEEITLKILATDMVNDIGLVKGQFNNKKYLNIKTDGAELGEDIIAFGYPLSQTLSDSVKLTKGIVSSLTGLGNNISQIQIDAAIQPGNSGGPVVNMNSQVVGIASAGLSKLYMAQKAAYIPENVNFAVASQTLTAFLKANKINIGTSASKVMSTKELAKIGEPVTLQLFCYNTEAAYAKLKKADKHSDVLLDLN